VLQDAEEQLTNIDEQANERLQRKQLVIKAIISRKNQSGGSNAVKQARHRKSYHRQVLAPE
jgi:hypothetical protein